MKFNDNDNSNYKSHSMSLSSGALRAVFKFSIGRCRAGEIPFFGEM